MTQSIFTIEGAKEMCDQLGDNFVRDVVCATLSQVARGEADGISEDGRKASAELLPVLEEALRQRGYAQ